MERSIEDQVLDAFWRELFDQPLPMLGAAPSVRAILRREGVTDPQIDAAIRTRRTQA